MHADVIKRLNAHVARDIARGGVGGGGGVRTPRTPPPPPASAPGIEVPHTCHTGRYTGIFVDSQTAN